MAVQGRPKLIWHAEVDIVRVDTHDFVEPTFRQIILLDFLYESFPPGDATRPVTPHSAL